MKQVFLLLLGTMWPAVCLATIINVPSEQPAIQAGIDAAADGDTVLVAMNDTGQPRSDHSQAQATAATDCFSKLAKAKPIGDSVTVFGSHGTIIAGSPRVDFSASMLWLRKSIYLGVGSYINIPFDEIDRISYRKRSGLEWGLALVGLAAGTVVGSLTGATLAPESEGWDFSPLNYGILGGMIGGLAGSAAGYELGKRVTVTVVLECR